MKLEVKLGSRTYIVDVPDQWTSRESASVTIGERTVRVRWDLTSGTATVVEPAPSATQPTVERNLRIRSATSATFPGESETSIKAEFNTGTRTTSFGASVARHFPGQAARGGTKSKKGMTVRSQITGKVLRVLVKVGDQVKASDPLVIIEAMKMENKITAAQSGGIASVSVKEGTMVSVGDELLRFKDPEGTATESSS